MPPVSLRDLVEYTEEERDQLEADIERRLQNVKAAERVLLDEIHAANDQLVERKARLELCLEMAKSDIRGAGEEISDEFGVTDALTHEAVEPDTLSRIVNLISEAEQGLHSDRLPTDRLRTVKDELDAEKEILSMLVGRYDELDSEECQREIVEFYQSTTVGEGPRTAVDVILETQAISALRSKTQ